MNKQVYFLLVFIGCSCQVAAATVLYNVVDIGQVHGTAINNVGQATGYSDHCEGGCPFLYSNGQTTLLGNLGTPGGQGRAINDSGQITGFSTTGEGQTHTFLYSNGQITDPLPTSAFSRGDGINNSGQITGFYAPPDGGQNAFLYGNGRVTNLGTLPAGAVGSYGLAVNNSGLVTGASYSQTGVHGFLYSNGQMIDIGTLGNPYAVGSPYTFSQGNAINNLGQITGYGSVPNGDHAFLYRNGSMEDLGTLYGSYLSEAFSINNNGQIVGLSAGAAFIYTSANGMLDLNTLIDPALRITLYQATSINDRGQILAENSTDTYILTPVPEPGTLALAAMMLLLLRSIKSTGRISPYKR